MVLPVQKKGWTPGQCARAPPPSGNGNDGRLGSSNSTDGRDADWVTGMREPAAPLPEDASDWFAGR